MIKMRWKIESVRKAAKNARSIREVIANLGLVPAGGNYRQAHKYLRLHNIDTTHFKGQGWNAGLKVPRNPVVPLAKILTKNSTFQSHKLKLRLFSSGIKQERCEECGWNKRSPDGRRPLELDHINGNPTDNRIVNLRILCPNCHSLKPTHRGLNHRRKK